ncbi:MAG TPA: MBL fold metallo-hydrolase [Thermoanaerobaculia bacterium]|jgi:L-ascorbate metabolism protein UlaG (beta-lactamase superfamily)|nr:MBL fold metallo-hydrolase [Thermoanaerobaculia bacterium]
MRRLLLLLLAGSALAQSPDLGQKMRDAQQAFGAGDCARAQTTLREIIAADPQNYLAHVLSAHCLMRQKDYAAAIGEFRRMLELRPETSQGVLGLIEAYARSGDMAHRDAEIEHLRVLMKAGTVPLTLRFVREQFTAGQSTVVVSEYPYLTALRSRYLFQVFDAQQKAAQQLELVSREDDQAAFRQRHPREAAAGARQFSLVLTPPPEANDPIVRVYGRGEPAYEQVVADVRALLAGKALSAGGYALTGSPAVVEPIPITVDDPSDPRLRLQPGQVAIEYIAHSCFRIHTEKGARLLIDPFASRVWLGYDFPRMLAADTVLITHPHYDHDADVLIGHQPLPWTPDVRVLRDPGAYKVSGATITGIRGKHADPWGKEFGQTNTIWLLELDSLRIVHVGDNGPLSEANLQELGRVDILMMPIDARHHILKEAEIQAIRKALRPRILIPMHYRLPDLESSGDTPQNLGEINSWLAGQENVVQLESNIATFTAGSLLPSQVVVVFPHSPKVSAARAPTPR